VTPGTYPRPGYYLISYLDTYIPLATDAVGVVPGYLLAGIATRFGPEAKYPGSGSGSGYFEVPGYLLIQRRVLYAGTRYLLKRAIRSYLHTRYLPEYLGKYKPSFNPIPT
jgi:hypothetical protein